MTVDHTALRVRGRFNELRALGIHPVAEIRWTSSTGWRAWVVGGHPDWAPGRTSYGAGVTPRPLMPTRRVQAWLTGEAFNTAWRTFEDWDRP